MRKVRLRQTHLNNCMKYSRGAFAFKLVLKNVLALVMILFEVHKGFTKPNWNYSLEND